MKKNKVLIVIGSESDREMMNKTAEVLTDFDIDFEMVVSSAHRNPEKTRNLALKAEKKGIKVIIAGAGMAAHLPGVIASHTKLPVIGVPLPSLPFKGIDSFFSILQMPSGVPVATMSVGSAGAKNAAILAAEILALSDDKIKKRLKGSIPPLAGQRFKGK
ncbi:MAG: 5-(carboxyamino)imidazole ribonucleotide mutase [candidate division Zixibacteria bacterium]|nr:5-(carboxyamino)imidazole ribonucleotide mutase [candidate division Zixibacteria bacterium]